MQTAAPSTTTTRTVVHSRDFERQLVVAAFEDLCLAWHVANRLPPLWPMVAVAASPHMPQTAAWVGAVLQRFPRLERLVLPGPVEADVCWAAVEGRVKVRRGVKELTVHASFLGSRGPDVSECDGLEELAVVDVRDALWDEDVVSALIKRNGATLKRLSCDFMSPAVAASVLASCAALEHFAVEYSRPGFVKPLVLQCAATLTSLDLSPYGSLSEDDFRVMSEALGPRLRNLSLTEVVITDTGLLSLFRNCTALECFRLYFNPSTSAYERITDESLSQLPPNLKQFDMAPVPLNVTHRTWDHIARTSGSTLEGFQLWQFNTGIQPMPQIAAACNRLTYLFLATENLTAPDAVVGAVRSLIHNNAGTLRTLCLWGGMVEALALGVAPLPQLRGLHCDTLREVTSDEATPVLPTSFFEGTPRLEQLEWKDASRLSLHEVAQCCPRLALLELQFESVCDSDDGFAQLDDAVAQLSDLASLILAGKFDDDDRSTNRNRSLFAAIHAKRPDLHIRCEGVDLYHSVASIPMPLSLQIDPSEYLAPRWANRTP